MARLLLLFPVLLALAQVTVADDSEERYLEQPLDHFDELSPDTWTMVRRYDSR